MNEIRIEIEGLKELTEAVRALAGVRSGQTMPAPVSQTGPSGMQNYMQTPVQPPVLAGVGAPQAVGGAVPVSTVPTTAMPQEYTVEQLQVAAAGLSSMGKMPQLMGILQRFGIQAMTELPRERYGEFAVALREAGAQI